MAVKARARKNSFPTRRVAKVVTLKEKVTNKRETGAKRRIWATRAEREENSAVVKAASLKKFRTLTHSTRSLKATGSRVVTPSKVSNSHFRTTRTQIEANLKLLMSQPHRDLMMTLKTTSRRRKKLKPQSQQMLLKPRLLQPQTLLKRRRSECEHHSFYLSSTNCENQGG